MKKPKIGSIVSGTMNPEHLLPAFLWELDYLGVNLPNLDGSPLYGLVDRNFVWIDSDSAEAESYLNSDDCQWDLEEIIETLNDIAPDYCYFGAHQDDGSDYGFWPDMESLEYDIKVGGLSTTATDGLWVEVSDHGNVTLWNGGLNSDSEEIWSVV